MDRLNGAEKVVGLKQSTKAVRADRATLVYVAEDAARWAVEPLLALCEEHGVSVETVASMKALAKACRVEVPTACAVLLKPAEQ